jgi:hypothetical protein
LRSGIVKKSWIDRAVLTGVRVDGLHAGNISNQIKVGTWKRIMNRPAATSIAGQQKATPSSVRL